MTENNLAKVRDADDRLAAPASGILDILRCPITGADLKRVGAEEAARLCADIDAGRLKHLDGTPARSAIGAFLRASESGICYPVHQEIYVLVPDFAIMSEPQRRRYASHRSSAATLAVMHFYDEIGWAPNDRGVFYDADINEDFRAVSARYIRDCHVRVNEHLPRGGDYLLDIASGPIQYEEYLSYSDSFAKRICCDVSFRALLGARARLGDKGIYIQADITGIPLKNGAVDGFVSLHTIYHVPAERQILAFRELERVTKRGGSGVVVYAWGDKSWGHRLAAPRQALAAAPGAAYRALRRLTPDRVVELLKRWRGRRPPATPSRRPAPRGAASQHCFYVHDYRWFKRNLATSGDWFLYSWRSVGLSMLKQRVPDNAAGRAFLACVFGLEGAIPVALGRVGQYPMFVFRKPPQG